MFKLFNSSTISDCTQIEDRRQKTEKLNFLSPWCLDWNSEQSKFTTSTFVISIDKREGNDQNIKAFQKLIPKIWMNWNSIKKFLFKTKMIPSRDATENVRALCISNGKLLKVYLRINLYIHKLKPRQRRHSLNLWLFTRFYLKMKHTQIFHSFVSSTFVQFHCLNSESLSQHWLILSCVFLI